ncbi:DNA polymerase Y family protein [Sphingomonas sp. DC1600-2]|uniref:Y-family DNA polymerase n=1 Tax=unclassified Sphingomonas TaxID=196159 RepID=UPI003CEE63B7
MKRVASLYLPDWPIERLAQAERIATPPERAPVDTVPLNAIAAQEQAVACSVPRGGGWRPGARWARTEEPPRGRRAGRVSEAAPHPFKAMPPDEGGAVVRDHRVGGDRHPGLVPGSTPLLERRNVVMGGPRHGAGVTNKAVITSLQSGNALLIAAACPAARALGLAPGMAVTQARALVPGLDIRPADPEGDRAALLRLAMLAARRWCPVVMPSGEDGLFLDISGTAHLFGGEARMARRIVALLKRHGFTARVAVADTPGAAWALARYAPQICPPGAHPDALAPLPTAALRLEPRARDLLKRLGIETIGQLAALPRAPLARRFGGTLIARLDQASGRLAEPLNPVIPPEAVGVVQRFAEPIATAEAIAHWLGVLMPRLVTALAEAGLGARLVDLVADRIDGVPQRLRIGLARPTRDGAHLLRLIVRRIEEIAPGYGIDALALHVRRADPLGAEPFAETLEDRAPDLAPLIDTLANRIGISALWRSVPVESDVPERSVAAAPPLDLPPRAAPKSKPDDVRQLDRSRALHPWDPRWPRPVRLLRRPELLDHVLAELPDQPPKRFTWRGMAHRVVRADGPERILGEWWKRGTERHSVRDYFQVEDEAGQRFWLFRRGDGERGETGDLAWFMHGSFG